MAKVWEVSDYYDPHPKRRIIEANTAAVDGHFLEEVPEVSPGFRPGVVLISREWQPELYFMKKYVGWGDAEYFEAAEKLIKELHIQPKRKDVVDKSENKVRETDKGE